jgi:hypothetical protein
LQAGRGGNEGCYTVGRAITDYLNHIEGKATHRATAMRLAVYVPPALAKIGLDRLTASDLQQWVRGMVKLPARVRTGLAAKLGSSADDRGITCGPIEAVASETRTCPLSMSMSRR